MAQPWKMPPIIKVYEALGAIGDRRVKLEDDRHATVGSSDGRKTYTVEWSPDSREIAANDNASYWQGYLGYPAIAMLLARGAIPFDPASARALAGIAWKELNHRFHNDYARTLTEVTRVLMDRGADPAAIAAQCAAIISAMEAYALLKGPRRRPPSSS